MDTLIHTNILYPNRIDLNYQAAILAIRWSFPDLRHRQHWQRVAPELTDTFGNMMNGMMILCPLSSTGQAGWDEDCDIAPETPDGQINELDLTEFADQWLYRSARFADIAPVEAPDGKVDMLDYCEFAENWQLGTD